MILGGALRARTQALPVLAALAMLVAVPHAARLELVHLPKLLVMTALAALLAYRGLLAPRHWRTAEWLLIAIFGVGACSAFGASHSSFAAVPLALSAMVIVVALGVARAPNRSDWLTWMTYAVVAAGAIGALEALGALPLAAEGRAPAACMGQRNTLAHFLVLGSPLVYERALAQRRWLPGAALLAFVVVTTRCRGAWVAGAGTLFYIAIAQRTLASFYAIGAVIGGALAAAYLPLALVWAQTNPYADSLQRIAESGAGSGAGRLLEWRESLTLTQGTRWLGLGPGNWYPEYGVTHGGNHFVHSDHVAALVEHGSVGFGLRLALFAVLFWRSKCLFKRSTLLAAALLGAFDAVIQLPAPLLLLVVVVFAGTRHNLPARPNQFAALACSGVLACGCLMLGSRLASAPASASRARLELAAKLDPFDPEPRIRLMRQWARAGSCRDAIPHARAAQQLLPQHPALRSAFQRCKFN